MTTYTPMQAYRAFDRIMKPRLLSNDLAERADAGYDAGEFSSAFFDMEHEQDAIMDMVAAKMSVTRADIHDAMCKAFDKFANACHEKHLPFPSF